MLWHCSAEVVVAKLSFAAVATLFTLVRGRGAEWLRLFTLISLARGAGESFSGTWRSIMRLSADLERVGWRVVVRPMAVDLLVSVMAGECTQQAAWCMDVLEAQLQELMVTDVEKVVETEYLYADWTLEESIGLRDLVRKRLMGTAVDLDCAVRVATLMDAPVVPVVLVSEDPGMDLIARDLSEDMKALEVTL